MDLRSGKSDSQFQATLEQYETAMKYFSQQKFEKAKALLEKVRTGPYKELSDRAALHLSVCNQRLQGTRQGPRSAEDLYNYAILQMNTAHYDEAEEYLSKAIKAEGKTAHVEYALAALHALKNELEPALVHLQEAIQMDARNRLLARNDDDFRLLMEDPRFTEILYPERS